MKNNKTNDGCVKIFNLLNLLYDNEATYERVKELFKEDIKQNSSKNYAHVILNKYMNTLKVFGIKVEKENNSFIIKNDLYTMQYTNSDIRAISILIKAVSSFPDEEIKKDVEKIINALKLRMSPMCKVAIDRYLGDYDFSFYYSSINDQIKYCQNLCKDAYILEIIFKDKEKIVSVYKSKPIELIYDSKNAYFRVLDPKINCKRDIAIKDILSIKPMPPKSSNNEICTTVAYTLKGRLANTYRLKDEETSPGLNENGHLLVINRNEPINKLLPRLMRYMDLCEIKTPKYVREKMKNLINDTIKKYK